MRKIKVFVSGRWQERNKVRRLMNLLEELGYQISYDWTQTEDKPRCLCGSDAVADIQGVKDADVYVGVFFNEHKYQGALIEMGVALALGKPVIVAGSAIDDCIFTYAPGVIKLKTLGGLCEAIKQATHYSKS